MTKKRKEKNGKEKKERSKRINERKKRKLKDKRKAIDNGSRSPSRETGELNVQKVWSALKTAAGGGDPGLPLCRAWASGAEPEPG